MTEISKLKTRLKNIKKNVTEYRMTIPEAQALLLEIEKLQTELAEKPKEILVEVQPPQTYINIMDGGSF